MACMNRDEFIKVLRKAKSGQVITYWKGMAYTMPEDLQKSAYRAYEAGKCVLQQVKSGTTIYGENEFLYQAVKR